MLSNKKNGGALVIPASTVSVRMDMDSKKTRIFANLNISDIQMPSTKFLRVRNCFHITAIFYFHLELMPKPVSLKMLGLKLVKLDCIIIKLDLDTIKKARNELDGACGLPLVKYISCDIIRSLPKQNIIFYFLLRDCVLGIGVKFWGNILMMGEKYFVPSENNFAAYEQPYSLVILMTKK